MGVEGTIVYKSLIKSGLRKVIKSSEYKNLKKLNKNNDSPGK